MNGKKLQKWVKDPKKGWEIARKPIPGRCGSISDRTQKPIFHDFGDFGDFDDFEHFFDNFHNDPTKRAAENGVVGGLHESRTFKIGKNVFRYP